MRSDEDQIRSRELLSQRALDPPLQIPVIDFKFGIPELKLRSVESTISTTMSGHEEALLTELCTIW